MSSDDVSEVLSVTYAGVVMLENSRLHILDLTDRKRDPL